MNESQTIELNMIHSFKIHSFIHSKFIHSFIQNSFIHSLHLSISTFNHYSQVLPNTPQRVAYVGCR